MINNVVDFARMSAHNLIAQHLHHYELLFRDEYIPRVALGYIYENSCGRAHMEMLVSVRPHIERLLYETSKKAAESSELMFEYASAHALLVAIRAALDDEIDSQQIKVCVNLISEYSDMGLEIKRD